jgi:hypothetical protein
VTKKTTARRRVGTQNRRALEAEAAETLNWLAAHDPAGLAKALRILADLVARAADEK